MAKVLRHGFLALVILVLILILIPWLFKGEIFQKIKDEANAKLKGELVIEDLSLSLFRDFPNLTVSMDKVSFINEAPFEQTTLFKVDAIRAKLDVFSVFKGEQIQVNQVLVKGGDVHLVTLEDGQSNYIITRDSDEIVQGDEVTDSDNNRSSFDIALNEFTMEGLNVVYEDSEHGVLMTFRDGTFQLAGNFDEIETDVRTITELDSLNLVYGSVNYLSNSTLRAAIDLNYNQESGRLLLTDNQLTLNALQLKLDGWLESLEDRLIVDFSFQTASADFKDVLSLVPVVYFHDYQNVIADGRFSFHGSFKGDYVYQSDVLPAFQVFFKVADGYFSYPDLPEAIDQINVDMTIEHSEGIADLTVVNISHADMLVAGNSFNLKLNLQNPFSDPLIDLTAHTQFDLSQLHNVLKFDDYDLTGQLDVDLKVKGVQSDIEKEKYERVNAIGYFRAGSMSINSIEWNEKIIIDTLNASVSPSTFILNPASLQLGQSDFVGKGKLDNLLAYALADDTLKGAFDFQSNFIHVTELMDMMASEELVQDDSVTADITSAGNQSFAVPPNINLEISSRADKIQYVDIELSKARATAFIKNGEVRFKDVRSDLLGGKISLEGFYKLKDGKPFIESSLDLSKIQAQSAFITFNSIKRFAPVAESASGSFGGDLALSSFLHKDHTPELGTMNASGRLKTRSLILQPEIMKAIGEVVGNSDLSKVLVEDADLSFQINDGRVIVSPLKIRVGGYAATFEGSHGLDQSLNYRLKTKLPIEKIKLPRELLALGLIKGFIPIELEIGGTLTNPKINPVFGEVESVSEIIDEIVDQVVEEVKDTIIETVNKEAERIMAEAKIQADSIKAEAASQAEMLKAEAKNQAEQAKQEARNQATKLINEAKGDPIKEFVAKAAAEALIKEADKKIDEINDEANKKADDLLRKANAEADRIMKEAEQMAKISNK